MPDSGSVVIHGRDIAGMSLDQLSEVRLKMGFLFQHAALYDSLTVEQNVAFPLQHHKRGMSNSERGDRVKQLAGGSWYGRASQQDAFKYFRWHAETGWGWRVHWPWILTFCCSTMPTAGLDPISSAEIGDLILKLQAEHHMASIVVTDYLHSAGIIANRLILLDEGNVAFEGTFQELQASDNELVREFLKHS